MIMATARKKTRIAPAKRVRPPPAIMRILPEGNTCRMVPASYSQERIWYGDQPRPDLVLYLLSFSFSFAFIVR